MAHGARPRTRSVSHACPFMRPRPPYTRVLLTHCALFTAPQGVLQARIAHLGLGRSRSERLIALSQAYCADPPVRGNVRPSRCYVDVGVGAQRQRYPPTEASHLPGSGPYALDSYRIFCAGEDEWKAVMPRDKELVRYLVSGALGPCAGRGLDWLI